MTTDERTNDMTPALCGVVVPMVAALGDVIATARTRDELVGRSLDVVAEAIGWPQAEAWTPGGDDRLRRAPGTLSLTPAAGRFTRESGALAFARGAGLPGLAWQCDGAVVLDALQAVPWYQRGATAADAGFDAAAAVAVGTDDGLEFVMAFHGPHVPDDRRLELLLTVAAAQLRGTWTRLGPDAGVAVSTGASRSTHRQRA